MFTIRSIEQDDIDTLSSLAATTFRESHGTSASPKDIEHYITSHYAPSCFELALQNSLNYYYFLLDDEDIIGYLNIIPNTVHPLLEEPCVCKLDRIYILQKKIGRGAGLFLFHFALQQAKQKQQVGFWLNVWEGNSRAIQFYKQLGFRCIGQTQFRISETHANPNQVLYLKF